MTRPAIWTAITAITLLAAGACTSSTTTSNASSAAADTGLGGHAPTLTGSGSTFDAPFFSVAFARYQQQPPAVTIG